jgi:putative endonuclease
MITTLGYMSNYFVYITTNPDKTVLYVGMTNNLLRRMTEHEKNKGNPETFAGEYYCYNLIWYERHVKPAHAINREKQIKRWGREKKEFLIREFNPTWEILNHRLY